jgi:hypothetical protein
MTDLQSLFQPCPRCGQRLPPILGCTAGVIQDLATLLTARDDAAALAALRKETGWDDLLGRGYLTCPHVGALTRREVQVLCQANAPLQADPKLMEDFDALIALQRERVTPGPGESLAARMTQDPSNAEDRWIRHAWNRLTHPTHLSGLRRILSLEVLPPGLRDLAQAALTAAKGHEPVSGDPSPEALLRLRRARIAWTLLLLILPLNLVGFLYCSFAHWQLVLGGVQGTTRELFLMGSLVCVSGALVSFVGALIVLFRRDPGA